MYNLDLQKEQEINKMVAVLRQIELSDLELLNRDANTLLMRKKRAEMEAESHLNNGKEADLHESNGN